MVTLICRLIRSSEYNTVTTKWPSGKAAVCNTVHASSILALVFLRVAQKLNIRLLTGGRGFESLHVRYEKATTTTSAVQMVPPSSAGHLAYEPKAWSRWDMANPATEALHKGPMGEG